MSTDYAMMCEVKKEENSKWEAYTTPTGEVWESKFWGISCIKSAFMRNNGHNNNQVEFSKDIENLYGHYRQLSICKDLYFNFEYLDSYGMNILSEFVLEMSNVMKDVEKYYEYRWVISPDC